MNEREYVQGLINKARVAQEEFETYSQEKVDEAVRAIGKAVYDAAESLSKMAVEETAMGVYEDKVMKNKGKSKAVWNKLKGVKSRNIIKYIEEQGLVEVAKPIGVIGAVTPTTNPTMTPMQNAMIALKGGNALLVCPHPRGKKCGYETVEVMRAALKSVGCPEDLLQCVPEPTMEISSAVMQMCDATIATGGPFMVHEAYSSGKPSFGVGAGNVQCVVDRDADLEALIPMVVRGRTYDNGVLCTCEQCVVCPEEEFGKLAEGLQENKGYLVPADKLDAFRSFMFPGGALNKDVVGQDATKIAAMAGLEGVPADTKFLFVQVEKFGADELFCKEKLCPVLTTVPYKIWDDAVKIAKTNILFEGTGHSAVIHSNTKEHIEELGETLHVSRLAVNQQGSSGLGGAINNGLNPTGTLGCGSWGNNSISENLWWHNLVNISRIAYVIPGAPNPTDEEIWG